MLSMSSKFLLVFGTNYRENHGFSDKEEKITRLISKRHLSKLSPTEDDIIKRIALVLLLIIYLDSFHRLLKSHFRGNQLFSLGYLFFIYLKFFYHIEILRKCLGLMAVCNLQCEGLTGSSGTPDLAQRKLFIGGLSPDVSSEMLLSFFCGKYGDIEEGSVAYDKDTTESRYFPVDGHYNVLVCNGFGFVTYKTSEAAKRALEDPQKLPGGWSIIVKFADSHGRKTAQPQLPPTMVPMGALMAAGYPQSGKAYPSPDPAGYPYSQAAPAYPGDTYPSPPAAPMPYAVQPQMTFPQLAVEKDQLGVPLTPPMGMGGYLIMVPSSDRLRIGVA
ncbi:hypothetical protein ACJRO7_007579 [Eucalyptus globulus]|uniref:RRM domain-containing protein n=1 Tax=Eucalyptus globulus TaxID=34317 RepID=A0ABD3IMR6_EUCGL